MMLTKEIIIHIAVVTVVTGAIFGIILSSGATDLDELKINAFARAELVKSTDPDNLNDIVFLSYAIHNMGDYDIDNVIVTVSSISHSEPLDDQDPTTRWFGNTPYSYEKSYNSVTDPLIRILESKEYRDVIQVTGMTPRDEVIVQFDASDRSGNHDVYIMTVPLE